MATPSSFSEESSSVHWKIQNFSFCSEGINSPVFKFCGSQYYLSLSIRSDYVDCQFWLLSGEIGLNREISFLTSDGSPEESISGYQDFKLRVPKDVIFRKRRNSFLPKDTLTVRFRYTAAFTREKVLLWSQIGVKRKCFLWTCENLSNRQGCFKRSVDTSKRYGDINFTLKFTGGFNTDENFFIEISRTWGERCYLVFKVSLVDVEGKSRNEVRYEFVFEKQDGLQTKMFPVFIKESQLLACKNLLLPDDTLSLKCDFAMPFESLEDQTIFMGYFENVKSFVREPDDLSMTVKEKNDYDAGAELQTDLKSILDDGTLFDGTLQINDEVIKIHKNILSARSPVFKSMFTQDMKESINSTVVIEDLDVATVRRLLLYMYTDSIEGEQLKI